MLFLIIMFACFTTVECAVPGTFFWKPRLALIMAHHTSEKSNITQPSRENIRNGIVVIIDGFRMGLCIAALAEDLVTIDQFPQLDPRSGYFYTTAFRWALRYISLLPNWLSGKTGHYAHTHRVWKKRFHYMDAFVPKWLRPALPFVAKEEWEREENEYKGYKKYAEKYFWKLFQYPGANYTQYKSQQISDTKTSSDSSSNN